MKTLNHLWFRLTRPFRTFVYIHQRTKITMRQFPFKLEIERVKALQEQIDLLQGLVDEDKIAGAIYPLEHAIYILDEPIELKNGITLTGG